MTQNTDYIDMYLTWMASTRNRAFSTLSTYGLTLVPFAERCDATGMDILEDIDVPLMEDFVGRKRHKPATRAKEVAILRSFYTWALEQGLTMRNPSLGLHTPTVHNKLPKPLSDDQWLRVWTKPSLTRGERLMLGLGFFLGLRREEMARLQMFNIGPENIHHFTRKGGDQSTLPWADMVAVYEDKLPHLGATEFAPLMRMCSISQVDNYVLPWQAGEPKTINKRLGSLFYKLGVPKEDRFTPHQLRHSAATNLLRAGVPLHMVTRLMNHSNPSTTMRYVQAGGRELREWLGKV